MLSIPFSPNSFKISLQCESEVSTSNRVSVEQTPCFSEVGWWGGVADSILCVPTSYKSLGLGPACKALCACPTVECAMLLDPITSR